MSLLLDTDICSAHLRDKREVAGKFVQHSGALYVSAITVGELYSWALRVSSRASYRVVLEDLLSGVGILEVDHEVARRFGIIRSSLLDQGKPAPPMDLLIAATALVHGLTLVTHNRRHYVNVPGLRIIDWLSS